MNLIILALMPLIRSTISNDDTVFDEFDDTFAHAINTCKIKERATDQGVEDLFRKVLPLTGMEKCFTACWFERFEVFKDRKFNKEQYIKLYTHKQEFQDSQKESLRRVLNNCKIGRICPIDRCEAAFKIQKCVYDGAMQMDIDPNDM